jgi:DNA-binding CsgD family transcriptional regulator
MTISVLLPAPDCDAIDDQAAGDGETGAPDPRLADLLGEDAGASLEQLAADLCGTPYRLLVTSDGGAFALSACPSAADGNDQDAVVVACATVPDIVTGAAVATVAIVAPPSAPTALVGPLVRVTARKLADLRASDHGRLARLLDDVFAEARRRTRAPLVLVSASACHVNTAASRILDRRRGPELWSLIERGVAPSEDLHCDEDGRVVVDRDGVAYAATIEWVTEGTTRVGAVLRFERSDGSGAESSARTAQYGWESLTAAERGIAALVSEGLSNRDVARRVYLSPHTVDSHLRHIYRKLGIGSRVELASMFTARAAAES